MKLVDEIVEVVVCWPDNWIALQVLDSMKTQWNVSANGVIGLRYEALPVVLNMLGVTKKSRADLLYSIRIMESAVLEVLNGN